MIKKIVALFLTALMLFSMSGCDAIEDGIKAGLEQAAEEAKKDVTRGVIDGNVYTSEYSDLTFTKPDDWTYSTDEEIATVMGIGLEEMNEDSFAETLAVMASVYDMMVTDALGMNNMVVMYENTALEGASSYGEQEYLEAVVDTMKATTTIVSTNYTDVTLSGQAYRRCDIVADYSGLEVTQYIYARKLGDYMSAVIVTLFDETSVSDIEAMFS